MKKSEVTIGGLYTAKVTDRIVTIRIDGTNRHGGWNATNLTTGKTIRIKSAQRLRGRADADSEAPPTESDVTPTVEIVTGRPLPKRVKNAGKPAADKPKRTSALDAAAEVLRETGEPMTTKAMIAAMAEKGLWTSPGGKTPHATLYSAILRELTTKGDDGRFRKVDRGQFAFNG